ncbi:MAG: peptidoglycan DD-metalloendopeptidase family protein [Bacteroidales bacterium]|nr:peptidoglycan DD-metalloendopeptidase family protein [Bacteroidales bacterium]
MAKGKFVFNPETLNFEKIEFSFKRFIYKAFTHIISSGVTAVVLMFVYLSIFPSPTEKKLREENKELKYNYEVINGKMDQFENILKDIQDRDDNIYRMIFEAEPIPSSVRKAGFGGVNKYAELEEKGNLELVIETGKQLDIILKQLYIQSKSFDQVIDLAKNKEQMLKSIPAIQPISDKELMRFSSGFGYRIHPIYKTMKFHEGVDLTAKVGTKIYATGDGVIKVAQFGRGYGKLVTIDHGYSYESLYGHMSQILVREGQTVKRGDVIGLVGNTGTSSGPHLHYEVRKNGQPINPINFYLNDLTPEEFDEMIEISSRPTQSFD